MDSQINRIQPAGGAAGQYRQYLILVGLLIVTAILGAAAVHSATGPTLPQGANPVLPVAALEVAPQPGYELARRFAGRVEAGRESELGFVAGGRLDEIRVDEGDRIEAGVVLARLDTARLEARHAELIAAHKAAEAQLERAKARLKRRESMVGSGATSREEVEQAREQFRSTAAAVELASARIDSVDVDLDRAVLRAPYPAIVTRRHVDEGRVVNAGEPILTLQEAAVPEVRVGIAGPLVDAVSKGQHFDLAIRGEKLRGQVKAILPLRGAGTRTVDVILTLDETLPLPLRAGDLVTLTLKQRLNQPGYWLPLDALAEGARGLWATYLLAPAEMADRPELAGATHTIVPHTVEILHSTTERAYVRGNLPRQALVVANGVHRVVPGQHVRLADGAAVAHNEAGHSHGRF